MNNEKGRLNMQKVRGDVTTAEYMGRDMDWLQIGIVKPEGNMAALANFCDRSPAEKQQMDELAEHVVEAMDESEVWDGYVEYVISNSREVREHQKEQRMFELIEAEGTKFCNGIGLTQVVEAEAYEQEWDALLEKGHTEIEGLAGVDRQNTRYYLLAAIRIKKLTRYGCGRLHMIEDILRKGGISEEDGAALDEAEATFARIMEELYENVAFLDGDITLYNMRVCALKSLVAFHGELAAARRGLRSIERMGNGENGTIKREQSRQVSEEEKERQTIDFRKQERDFVFENYEARVLNARPKPGVAVMEFTSRQETAERFITLVSPNPMTHGRDVYVQGTNGLGYAGYGGAASAALMVNQANGGGQTTDEDDVVNFCSKIGLGGEVVYLPKRDAWGRIEHDPTTGEILRSDLVDYARMGDIHIMDVVAIANAYGIDAHQLATGDGMDVGAQILEMGRELDRGNSLVVEVHAGALIFGEAALEAHRTPVVYVNHAINVCGVCRGTNSRIMGFLVKDTAVVSKDGGNGDGMERGSYDYVPVERMRLCMAGNGACRVIGFSGVAAVARRDLTVSEEPLEQEEKGGYASADDWRILWPTRHEITVLPPGESPKQERKAPVPIPVTPPQAVKAKQDRAGDIWEQDVKRLVGLPGYEMPWGWPIFPMADEPALSEGDGALSYEDEMRDVGGPGPNGYDSYNIFVVPQ